MERDHAEAKIGGRRVSASSAWDKLFEQQQFLWKDPDRKVVEFAVSLRDKNARSVLDLGCGAGRHLVYLASQGFKAFGVDVSQKGLEAARERLRQEGMTTGASGVFSNAPTGPRLAQANMSQIPFRDASFDGLIAVHVIQHQTVNGIRTTVNEIRRVLSSGGLTYLTFASRHDSRWGKGQAIEPDTFIAGEGPDGQVPHHYSNLAEIEELLDGLRIRRVDLTEHKTDQGDTFSHWEVLAEKL